MSLIPCLLLLAFAVLYSNGIILECLDGGEFNYKKTELPSNGHNKLVKLEQFSSVSCAGAIDLDFRPNFENQEWIWEVAENLFQDLPLVTSIKIDSSRATFLPSNIFAESNAIHTIDFTRCEWVTFDKDIIFSPSVTRFILDYPRPFFDQITSDFFANNENLRYMQFSNPQGCLREPFARGVFQSALNLETLDLTNVCLTKLSKGLFTDIPKLTSLNLDLWKDLTVIDPNAFEDIVLSVLSLRSWKQSYFVGEIFSGASIDRLDLKNAKLQSLFPGIFSNLKTKKIELDGSSLTSIESGAFDNFQPEAGFSLSIPSDISCCNLEGLFELMSRSSGIEINQSTQNYTCVTPAGTSATINLNENPSSGLSCCSYDTQYFDDITESCKECTLVPEFCSTPSNVCQGEVSSNLNCNQCNVGYHNMNNLFQCQACAEPAECMVVSNECSASNKEVLKCKECSEGYSVDPISGLCIACIQTSAECTSYGTSCIIGTNSLQCTTCGSGTTVNSSGACVKTGGLSGTILIGIIAGIVVVAILVVVGLVAFALFRRKKRKEKKLNQIFGIGTENPLVELQSDEQFLETYTQGEYIYDPSTVNAGPLNNNEGTSDELELEDLHENQNENEDTYVAEDNSSESDENNDTTVVDDEYDMPQSRNLGSMSTNELQEVDLDKDETVDEQYFIPESESSTIVVENQYDIVPTTQPNNSETFFVDDEYHVPETAANDQGDLIEIEEDEYFVPDDIGTSGTKSESEAPVENDYHIPQFEDNLLVDDKPFEEESDYHIPEFEAMENNDQRMVVNETESEYANVRGVTSTLSPVDDNADCNEIENDYHIPEFESQSTCTSYVVEENESEYANVMNNSINDNSYKIQKEESVENLYDVHQHQDELEADDNEYHNPPAHFFDNISGTSIEEVGISEQETVFDRVAQNNLEEDESEYI